MKLSVLQTVCLTLVVIATVVGIGSFIRGLSQMVSIIAEGAPAPGRGKPIARRLWLAISKPLSHSAFMGRPFIKAAHWLVMVSFPLLFLTLVAGYGQVVNPHYTLPILGSFAPWEWIVEAIAWASMAGIIWLIVVRTRAGKGRPGEAESAGRDGQKKPSRFLGSAWSHARFVEGVILGVVICVLLLRILEYALLSKDPATAVSAWHFPFTFLLGKLAAHASVGALQNAIVVTATVKIVISMAWMVVVGLAISMGVAWHRFLAFVNIYARRKADGSKALGAAAPMYADGKPVTAKTMENLEALEGESLGVGSLADMTWKDRLDIFSCTECGRCQEVCPAWATGKPLSPKLFITALRDHAVASSSFAQAAAKMGASDTDELVQGTKSLYRGSLMPHNADVLGALRDAKITGTDGVAIEPAPLVGNVISPETLWACTTCGACVDQCPTDLEILDHIIDIRRHQVTMQSAFPQDLARPLRSLQRQQNPYGISGKKRLDWAKDLDFDVPVVGQDIPDASSVDYLFWVGCAGAYDDRAKKTTQAVAQMLHHAGVTFAVLGSGESCTGDPARRAGNELLYQTLAAAAVEKLNEAAPKRIVVTCAHCFNTIRNEYPELGGNYQVIHHTELLSTLVAEGKLKPLIENGKHKVTLHDACYLGRHNGIYNAPRELLGALPGFEVTEMPRTKDRAMCCGAGGAHAFMQDTIGVRIADARVSEAAATGADTVATACPFCSTMLASGRPQEGEAPQVADVAILLRDAVLEKTVEEKPVQQEEEEDDWDDFFD